MRVDGAEGTLTLDHLKSLATYFVKIHVKTAEGDMIRPTAVYKFQTIGWFAIFVDIHLRSQLVSSYKTRIRLLTTALHEARSKLTSPPSHRIHFLIDFHRFRLARESSSLWCTCQSVWLIHCTNGGNLVQITKSISSTTRPSREIAWFSLKAHTHYLFVCYTLNACSSNCNEFTVIVIIYLMKSLCPTGGPRSQNVICKCQS